MFIYLSVALSSLLLIFNQETMSLQQLITGIVETTVATGIGGFFGWFFTRKKQNIDTIDAAIGTWQKVVDSLEKQVQKQLVSLEALRNERDSFSTQVSELVELREKDSIEIKHLRLKVDELSERLKQNEVNETLILDLRKQVQEKDLEIERLKTALAS